MQCARQSKIPSMVIKVRVIALYSDLSYNIQNQCEKKNSPSLYHQNNGILKALVTTASLNKALNSKSSTNKKEYNTRHSTQHTTTKREGGGGRKGGREGVKLLGY